MAIDKAETVRNWMMSHGAYAPVMAMSGNGSHLLFPVDLPNNDESLALVKSLLSGLSAKFSDDTVDVDETVCNAARICRLYGTSARKGDNTEDRPHRVSELLQVPDYLESGFEATPPKVLAALSKILAPKGKPPEQRQQFAGTESRLVPSRYLRRLGIEYRENHKAGKEVYQIDCPFDVNHKRPDAFLAVMESGASVFSCSHDSCKGNKWHQFKELFGAPQPDEFDPPLRQSSPPALAPPKAKPKPEPQKPADQKTTTLAQATLNFAATIDEPSEQLIELGLGDLDRAIGGGIAAGEMVLIAARPGHGKSLVALQIVHKLTASGVTCCFMSEEMSSSALGKRTALYATPTTEKEWRENPEHFKQSLDVHFHHRAECHIMESSRTAERMCDNIRTLQKKHGVQCAVVDYAQLLQGKGGNRYEQVTNTSIALRHLATETGVSLIVLCQMSRAIEGRTTFIPQMGDLKDSGQLEQDADVLVYLVWPHRLNPDKPETEYAMFVNKNRNRGVIQGVVACNINPARQRIDAAAPAWQSAAESF